MFASMFVSLLWAGCGPGNEEETMAWIRFPAESGVTQVELHGKQITFVTPPAKLTDLTPRGLDLNQITYATPFTELTKIQTLYPSGNPSSSNPDLPCCH